MFGVANHLLGTMAVLVGTVYIFRHTRKKRYALLAFLPAVFMFVTTVVAGIMNIFGNYLPKH